MSPTPTPADAFKGRTAPPGRSLEGVTVGLYLPADTPPRFRYEAAVLRSELHPIARLVALALATMCDADTGDIPASRQPGVRGLALACRLPGATTRHTLGELERLGWIHRGQAPGSDQAWFALAIPPATRPTP